MKFRRCCQKKGDGCLTGKLSMVSGLHWMGEGVGKFVQSSSLLPCLYGSTFVSALSHSPLNLANFLPLRTQRRHHSLRETLQLDQVSQMQHSCCFPLSMRCEENMHRRHLFPFGTRMSPSPFGSAPSAVAVFGGHQSMCLLPSSQRDRYMTLVWPRVHCLLFLSLKWNLEQKQQHLDGLQLVHGGCSAQKAHSPFPASETPRVALLTIPSRSVLELSPQFSEHPRLFQ